MTQYTPSEVEKIVKDEVTLSLEELLRAGARKMLQAACLPSKSLAGLQQAGRLDQFADFSKPFLSFPGRRRRLCPVKLNASRRSRAAFRPACAGTADRSA